MIEFADHLLPEDYSPLEKALSATSTRLDDIPVPIREIWDPWLCPEPFLRIMAHAFSVDLWVDTWSTARKRSIIANAVRLAREKGTLAAIRDYLAYVDAELIKATVRPQQVFSGPSLTRAQREAWLSGLPQVRVWRVQEEATRTFELMSSGSGFSSFFETSFPMPSTALKRLHRRARWVVDGVETDARVTEFGSYFRVHVKAPAGLGSFSGGIMGTQFLTPSTASKRLVTIQPAERLPWRSSVLPRLEPVTAEPERVVERGAAGREVFSDIPFGGKFFLPSTAWRRIYQRYAVHDGRRVNRSPSIQFMGVGRYGFPSHTARLKISIPGKVSPYAAGEGVVAPRSRFWLPHDKTRLLDVRRALTAAARASDRLLIEYADRPQMVAGEPFFAGVDRFVVGRPGG